MELISAKIQGFSWFIANPSWPAHGGRAGPNRRAGCVRGRWRRPEMIPLPRPLCSVEIPPVGGAAPESAPQPAAAPNRAAGGPGERSLIVLIGANAGFPCVSR